MFGIFKRRRAKEEVPAQLPPPECPHTWKDFPWYMKVQWEQNGIMSDTGNLTIEIFEPYICVHCKQRKDIKLVENIKKGISAKSALNCVNDYEELFAEQLEPIPVVEDMIHDYFYVDREKLRIYEKIKGMKG